MSFFSRPIALLHNQVAELLKSRSNGGDEVPSATEGVDFFLKKENCPPKRALLLFHGAAISYLLNKQQPRFFNPDGATCEFIRALNELEYIVDLVDMMDADYRVHHKYDLFLWHGDNSKYFLSQLPAGIKKIQYSSGANIEEFNRQSMERYERYFKSRNREGSFESIRRIQASTCTPENTDLCITLGEMTALSYKDTRVPVVSVNNAAYPDSIRSALGKRSYEKARMNFVYVSGTNGNIQKGADILIEAFYSMPDKHLYIFSRLEEDILKYYKKELSAPNIHYVYYWKQIQKLWVALFEKCAFSICLAINTGQSTAFIGSMNCGLIPVYNKEADIPVGDYGVLIRGNTVKDVQDAVRIASGIEAKVLCAQSKEIEKLFFKNHQPDVYRKTIKNAIQLAEKIARSELRNDNQ